MNKLMILMVLMAALCSAPAWAADNPKIGVVSIDLLLQQAPQVKAANDELKNRFSPRKDKLDSLEQEIKESQDKFKRDELVMTPKQSEETRKQIIDKVQDYRRQEETLAQELNTARNQALAEFRSEIREVLDAIAEEEKYDLILTDGVAFFSKKMDITDKVLKKLEKSFSGKK